MMKSLCCKLGHNRDFLTPQICFNAIRESIILAKISEFTVKKKNTTHHPLKQKWTVPIDNGWENPFGLNGLNLYENICHYVSRRSE